MSISLYSSGFERTGSDNTANKPRLQHVQAAFQFLNMVSSKNSRNLDPTLHIIATRAATFSILIEK